MKGPGSLLVWGFAAAPVALDMAQAAAERSLSHRHTSRLSWRQPPLQRLVGATEAIANDARIDGAWIVTPGHNLLMWPSRGRGGLKILSVEDDMLEP